MNKTTNKSQLSSGEFTNTPFQRLGMQVSLRRRQAGYSLDSFAQITCIPIVELAAIELGMADEKIVFSNLDKISIGLGLQTTIFSKFLKTIIQQ